MPGRGSRCSFARFNSMITGHLERAARERLVQEGIAEDRIESFHVPGGMGSPPGGAVDRIRGQARRSDRHRLRQSGERLRTSTTWRATRATAWAAWRWIPAPPSSSAFSPPTTPSRRWPAHFPPGPTGERSSPSRRWPCLPFAKWFGSATRLEKDLRPAGAAAAHPVPGLVSAGPLPVGDGKEGI